VVHPENGQHYYVPGKDLTKNGDKLKGKRTYAYTLARAARPNRQARRKDSRVREHETIIDDHTGEAPMRACTCIAANKKTGRKIHKCVARANGWVTTGAKLTKKELKKWRKARES
jgi:hypothetical protein